MIVNYLGVEIILSLIHASVLIFLEAGNSGIYGASVWWLFEYFLHSRHCTNHWGSSDTLLTGITAVKSIVDFQSLLGVPDIRASSEPQEIGDKY